MWVSRISGDWCRCAEFLLCPLRQCPIPLTAESFSGGLYTITSGIFPCPTFLHEAGVNRQTSDWAVRETMLCLGVEHQGPSSETNSSPCSWFQDFGFHFCHLTMSNSATLHIWQASNSEDHIFAVFFCPHCNVFPEYSNLIKFLSHYQNLSTDLFLFLTLLDSDFYLQNRGNSLGKSWLSTDIAFRQNSLFIFKLETSALTWLTCKIRPRVHLKNYFDNFPKESFFFPCK